MITLKSDYNLDHHRNMLGYDNKLDKKTDCTDFFLTVSQFDDVVVIFVSVTLLNAKSAL